MLIIKRILALISIFALAYSANATHNRAGEISFVQISDLAIRVLVTTYTKTSSIAADRDSLIIDWGDGTFSTIPRVNGAGEPLPNNIKKNLYIAEHTFPGRGTYELSVTDPNRVENILNIDPPNSVNIPFFIQTTVTLLNLQFQYPNHSVQLLQSPIDFACVGQLFIHNPSAYDEDGDSLSFELIVPLMDKNTPVPNYIYPNQIQAGINNVISLNKNDGTFSWNSPQRAGEYNIAFVIHEYRKGVRIASTIRDMQIFVRNDCQNNRPPYITAIEDTCIVAGTNLILNITATDIDTSRLGSKIKIEANGAPFFSQPRAVLHAPIVYSSSPIQATLEWKTDCSLIRKEFYTLVIRVTDNYLDTTGLSYLHIIRIKIVGPAPENLESEIQNQFINLRWTKPYVCDTSQLLFRGFSVWRREGSRFLKHDTCLPGLSTGDYQQIAYLVNKSQLNYYVFQDTTALKGNLYCYRILAEFAKLSSQGFPVNFISSLHSNETCNSIAIENPILLNVDVQETDSGQGRIFIKWQRPVSIVFDTLINPPPYQSTIFHKENLSTWIALGSSVRNFASYSQMLDTSYVHANINTQDAQHEYYLQLTSSNNSYSTDSSQSIFLQCSPRDQSLELKWHANTAWTNYRYVILRYNDASQQFDSIAETSQTTFLDKDLRNNSLYCYKVKSVGEYGIHYIDHPLENNSNSACARPVDNEAPCCPVLKITGPCNENQNPDPDHLSNYLNWNNPNPGCLKKDAIGYRIYGYYGHQKILIKEIDDIGETSYEHQLKDSIPGCYQLTAFDEHQNECLNSDTICVAYCPYYLLPNTFTPNNDGFNDIFKPYPYLFIQKINLKIFNRWGNLVFTTQDPDINWNGNDLKGNRLSDGVYYYYCEVYYNALQTGQPLNKELSGFIELLSGKK